MDSLGEAHSKSVKDEEKRGSSSEVPRRPERSTGSPAPIGKLAPTPPPGTMRLAQFLWVVSFLVGAGCIFIVYFVRESQLDWLRELVREMSLDTSPDSLDSITGLVFWASVGAVSFVILIEVFLVSTVMRARNWARWTLVVVILLHLAVTVLAGAFLVPPGNAGPYVLWFLAVQLILALAATVVTFLPVSAAWIRSGARAV